MQMQVEVIKMDYTVLILENVENCRNCIRKVVTIHESDRIPLVMYGLLVLGEGSDRS